MMLPVERNRRGKLVNNIDKNREKFKWHEIKTRPV
jgi:hypothetical protein